MVTYLNKMILVRSIDLTSGFSGDTDGIANQTLPHSSFKIHSSTLERSRGMKVFAGLYNTDTFQPVVSPTFTYTLTPLYIDSLSDVVEKIIFSDVSLTSVKQFESRNIEFLTTEMAFAITSVTSAITAQAANIKLGVFITMV